ncbi:MAG: Rrf2 family transcriptional regulator [Desulfovibrio sp.]|jgi:Rrf2 family protein|nr:Rrf2 family transcriptional regulator [Desulfovibrio sp.]
MKISTKGRYAVRILLDLAENQKDGYISLKSIAERQDISKGYLEQIISILRNAVVVSASRGFQGGYRLVKTASEYTVGDILRLTEGDLATVACLEKGVGVCARQSFCLTRPVWVGLTKVIADYLDSITLQNILDANRLPGDSPIRADFKRRGC